MLWFCLDYSLGLVLTIFRCLQMPLFESMCEVHWFKECLMSWCRFLTNWCLIWSQWLMQIPWFDPDWLMLSLVVMMIGPRYDALIWNDLLLLMPSDDFKIFCDRWSCNRFWLNQWWYNYMPPQKWNEIFFDEKLCVFYRFIQ